MRVVALGDSLTAGYGLTPADGFTEQLDRWLDEKGRGDVEVVNMGVSGDTTAGGLARLEWALGGGADAVIVALGGNDMLRGIDPAAARENLAGILSTLKARGIPVLIAGMKAPLNYGPDYKRDFEAMFPELAEEYGAILYPFFLAGIADDQGGGAQDLFQEDGLHPNAEGVSLMVEGIGPDVLRLMERAEE